MEPWGNLAFLAKSSLSKPFEGIYYCEKTKQGKVSDLKFQKTRVFERDQHAKLCTTFCIKSPSGSIRNNCQKIFSWSWSPETFRSSVFYQEDLKPYWKSKTATFLEGWISLLFASFLKDFVDHRKKTKRTVIFSCRPLDNILEDRDRRWNIQTIWKTRFLETHFEDFIKVVWKFWLTVLQNHGWNKIRTRYLW